MLCLHIIFCYVSIRYDSTEEPAINFKDNLMLNELQSKGDLAGFLGLSLEKLDLFVYPTSMYDLYRNRLVPKRNGGYRELLIPRSDLKRAQRLIASELEKGYKPLPCVHGFVKGRSIKTNAENHIGSQVIVGLDIKDFFPSISSRRVCGLLVSKKLGLTPEVAFCISRIVATPKGLPQGAPSSPIISNMICLGMDKQLMHLSREYRYQYSRYADDLTFSFNSSYFFYRNFYSGGKLRLPNKLRNAITNFHGIESFELNEDKSFYSCSFSRQLVTGVVCNQKTNIKREQYRRLRSTLHRLSNGDIEGAMGCYYGKTIAKLTDAERGSFEASLRGSLDFYKSLIKDPWTSGPLMRLGSLYNKTKPEDTPVFLVALQQDSLLYLEGEDDKQNSFEGLGFYLAGYGLVTAWHVICDAVSRDKNSREIKLFSSDKTPLAIFRFGNEVVQDNKRDAAILQDVPPAILKNIPLLPSNMDLLTKGDRISAYQHHFSESRFSFELHSGDLLRIGEPSEDIGSVATAYRSGFHLTNCSVAADAIDAIRGQGDSLVITGDFTHFFDNLDHSYLRKAVRGFFNEGVLPPDHYQVLKNILHYCYWPVGDLARRNGLGWIDLQPDDPFTFVDSASKVRSKALRSLNRLPRILTPAEFSAYKGSSIVVP